MTDWEGEAFVYQKLFVSNLREGKSTVSSKTAFQMLRSLNMPVTKASMTSLVKKFDVDGDERLGFNEFIELMRYLRSYGPLS